MERKLMMRKSRIAVHQSRFKGTNFAYRRYSSFFYDASDFTIFITKCWWQNGVGGEGRASKICRVEQNFSSAM